MRAVAAAAEAAPGWADTPAPVRAQALFRALEIMERRAPRKSPAPSPRKRASPCPTPAAR